MKVLIVNTFDFLGGAARATYRLHKALLDSGIDSQMLVQTKKSNDFTIIGPVSKIKKGLGEIKPTIDQLPLLLYKDRIKTYFSPSWIPSGKLINQINKINPDIVHLNWVNGGMLRIEDILKINCPIVWTLHDNWLFTGGCHIMWDCLKYKKECGKCPILNSEKDNDLSRKIFKRKEKVFQIKRNITVVGVSNWITSCSKESTLLKNKEHITIPNAIDTSIFKPFDKEKARNLWNLPSNKKLVLFGAIRATSDVNKGFQELSEALKNLVNNEIELVIFGTDKPETETIRGFKLHYVGQLHDDISLVTLYSAVDVMVVPSRQESFGQTASESMSCGTPVVCFSHTGLLDIVDHKINGYLAKEKNSSDLAIGIEYILFNKNYQRISEKSREKIVSNFDSKIISTQFINTYKKCLGV